MSILLARVCRRRHHSQQGFEAPHRETAGRGLERGGAREARGSDRNHPFDAWVEPHDTDASKPWLRGDPNQWEGQAIQRVGWISHLYGIGWKCGELEWGILM
jgi:hypothetical protein